MMMPVTVVSNIQLIVYIQYVLDVPETYLLLAQYTSNSSTEELEQI